MIDSWYGALTVLRRHLYERGLLPMHALARPVVSIGSLTAGGAGKTPLASHVAALLRDAGLRPSILSRGYARSDRTARVVVVSDGERIRADLPRAGDEPLLLARTLPGVAVVVSPNRALAGRMAEEDLGCLVHVLDDGFQHLALRRNVNLLIINRETLQSGLLPRGRLREPLSAARAADGVVVADERMIESLASLGLGVPTFTMTRKIGRPRLIEPFGRELSVAAGNGGVVAVAGLAHPERFFADLETAGWSLVRRMAFRDHHPFGKRDVEEMVRQLRVSHAQAILTTEKDLMRLLPWRPIPAPIAWVPLDTAVHPADGFRDWLLQRLGTVRSRPLSERASSEAMLASAARL